MNKHVLPPTDAKVRPRPGGDSDVQELPRPETAEAKSPLPKPNPDTAKSESAQSPKGQTQEPKTSDPAPERSFWTRRRLGTAGGVAAVIVGALLWWPAGTNEPKIAYRFTKASVGTVIVSVRSTGSLEARNTVDIVAPAGGRVQSLAVKSGDSVIKGQPLAVLVSDTARDELASATDTLGARQADLIRAEADVTEARALAARARNEKTPGASDGAVAHLARTLAGADEARVGLREAQSDAAAARARVQALDVRAPFDAMVLKTNIDPSKNVPVIARGQPLLTLVADLSQLNLTTDFPENALGALRVGEQAEFSAPAFPRRTFPATLTSLDLWPKKEIKDGREMVSYSGTLTGANPNGLLRPGMTANIAIVIAQAKDVLVVPNGALSFTPLPKIEAKYPPVKAPLSGPRVGRVWVLVNGAPDPRDVTLGMTDGRITQIASGPLHAGDSVITGSVVEARGSQP